MDALDSKTITKCWMKLVNDITLTQGALDGILTHLTAHGIIEPLTKHDIMLKVADAQRTRDFLNLLQRRGPNAYDTFVKALEECNNEKMTALANSLKETKQKLIEEEDSERKKA